LDFAKAVERLEQPEVNYCFRCGRRLGRGLVRASGKCLYCAAPTIRAIRPARRCPFCDQPISHRAIKCHHCGELLDENAKKRKAAEQPASTTFVIDKAVIHADPRAALPPGGDPARALEDRSGGGARALPPGREAAPRRPAELAPSESPEPRRRQLPPAGESRELVSASSGESHESRDVETIAAEPDDERESRELERAGARGELAVRDAAAPSDFLPALWKAAKGGLGALGRAATQPKSESDVLDIEEVDAEARYRICGVCQTEILAEDNYCFHCGQRYGKVAAGAPFATARSNVPLHLLALAGAGGHWAVAVLLSPDASTDAFRWARPLLASIALALPVFALYRKPALPSRAISATVLLIAAAVVFGWGPFGR
jgi:predicted nucleic acid-binding Zn ribbon protein